MKLKFCYMSLISSFLSIAVIASALLVVYSKQQCRTLYAELQNISESKILAQQKWHNLLVERGAFLTDGRVELVAMNNLNMYTPTLKRVTYIKL